MCILNLLNNNEKLKMKTNSIFCFNSIGTKLIDDNYNFNNVKNKNIFVVTFKIKLLFISPL